MKKQIVALALGLTMAHSWAQAALPPTYQRIAELKAILDSADVVKSLPDGAPIDRMEYVKPDLYNVSAGNCALAVSIKNKPFPNDMVGARLFDVEVGTLTCKELIDIK